MIICLFETINQPTTSLLPRDALLSAVYAVVVCLCVCVCVVHAVVVSLSVPLSVRLQIMPHDRPETLVFKWDVL